MSLNDSDVSKAESDDWEKACKILGVDPEEAQADEKLFADVAFFLMETEVI